MNNLLLPISALDLSVRSMNCLDSIGVHQVSQLVELTESELLGIRHFGVTSLNEITQQLSSLGLSLKSGAARYDDSSSAPAVDTAGQGFDGFHSLHVSALELSVRPANCLEKAGVSTIGQIVEMSRGELMSLRNFGETCYIEVQKKLKKLSLNFETEYGSDLNSTRSNIGSEVASLLDEKALLLCISELNLSQKAKTVLTRARCINLGDVLSVDLSSVRDMGYKTKAELIRFVTGIKTYGLSLNSLPYEFFFELQFLPFSRRARNFFKRNSYIYVGDIIHLERLELLEFDNVGENTAEEIEALKKSIGLPKATIIPAWVKDSVHAFSKAHEAEIKIKFQEFLRQNYALKDAKSIEGELDNLLAALVSGRHESRKIIFLDFLGLSKEEPPTLEEIGVKYGVTRERIRQITSRIFSDIRDRKWMLRLIPKAFSLIENAGIRRDYLVPGLLKASGLASGSIYVKPLIRLAKQLQFEHALLVRSINGYSYVGVREDYETFFRVQRLAKSLTTSRGGSASLSELNEVIVQQYGEELPDQRIVESLELSSKFLLLGESNNWFLRLGDRNRLINTINKVLVVCNSVPLNALRAGLMRTNRLKGGVPPVAILKDVVSHIPGVTVRNDIAHDERGLEVGSVLKGVTLIIYDIMQSGKGVISYRELLYKCLEAGVNRTTASIYIMTTPILFRVDKGFYAIVGDQVSEADFEGAKDVASLNREKNSIYEFGTNTELHEAWFVSQINKMAIATGSFLIPRALRSYFSFDRYQLLDHNLEFSGYLRVSDNKRLNGCAEFLKHRGAELGDFVRLTANTARPIIKIEISSEPFDDLDSQLT